MSVSSMASQSALVGYLLLVVLAWAVVDASHDDESSSVLPANFHAKVVSGPSNTCPEEQQTKEEISDDVRTVLRDTVIPALRCAPGLCEGNPATSCKQISQELPSGNYWLRKWDGSAVQVFCDMNRRCCNSTGGWMRVAYLNMTDPSQECPRNLYPVGPPRSCEPFSGEQCVSEFYHANGIPYSRVCGRIIGYQDGTTNAFTPFYNNPSIDDIYVDGVSLTYGHGPRKHIWTFAAALDETRSTRSVCPCIKTTSTFTGRIPPFVGNDYFCDTASETTFRMRFYPEDPLWDGEGCGPTNACCTFNNPPWFCKQLQETTVESIEMRVCGDQTLGDENVALELVELYVQ